MTSPVAPHGTDKLTERVLILVRRSRDAELTRRFLFDAGVDAHVCANVGELCAKMEEGAAAALLTEEVLSEESVDAIAKTLRRQPPWSDFPIVVFSSSGGAAQEKLLDGGTNLGNVTFLDRPVQMRTMLASVGAAIRSRRRQYEGRRAIESRDTFLAMLGHELRNPLGAIHLAATMLEQKSPDEVRPREHVIIERQAQHLSRLVDDLLDVARVTHGKVLLKRERVNVVEIARSAFEAQEARARDRQLAYEIDVPTCDLWVIADRQRLEQIFANLLTNAVKYTAAGGSVRMSLRTEGREAVVEVMDTGMGIAPEMLSRIFEVFAQAERTLERTEGGIGLGLALVKSLVQLHGGKVDATSEGMGRGSSFVVRLPRLKPSEVPAPPLKSAASVPSHVRRVVVVEDGADIRELLVELLEHEGHVVAAAEDGPQGLEQILGFGPDVAFVDLGLPGFDGLEVARRARAAGSTARLIAVTGYGQPEDRKQALDAGFDGHLTKPIGLAQLRAALQPEASPSPVARVASP